MDLEVFFLFVFIESVPTNYKGWLDVLESQQEVEGGKPRCLDVYLCVYG